MESLPDQRIEALPGATRQEAYWRIQVLCALRSSRDCSEDTIAKNLGFGNAEAMYHQLKNWGLTGLLPPDKQEETPKPKAVEAEPGQKARSSGQPKELPDPSDAADLFNDVLDELRETVKILEHLSLVYQAGRFTGTYTFEFSWVSGFSAPGVFRAPTETGPFPPREVVVLIAAYALVGRPIEPLLELLYPEHSQADIEKINKLLYETKSEGSKDGLLRTAQQLAAVVFGHKVERGAPPEQPAGDDLLACHITERREADVTDEEIHQEILSSGRELSKEDFTRLAKLGRRFPTS